MGHSSKFRGTPLFWIVLALSLPVGPLLLSGPGRVFLIRMMHETQGLDVAEVSFGGFDREAEREPYVVDREAHAVRRRDGPDRFRWSTPLEGTLEKFRGPHLVWDRQRVYVTQGDGVTALDAETGAIRWHSAGPQDRLCLSDLLLAVEFPAEGGGRLLARSVDTGESRFELRLGMDVEPEGVREILGRFLIEGSHERDGGGTTLLVERDGKVVRRFDRPVLHGLKLGKEEVFLTSDDVRCFAEDGRLRWQVRIKEPESHAGGGLTTAAGDLIAHTYGRISNSGVQVLRIDPKAGTVVWQTACRGLRVEHSEYHHEAKIVEWNDHFIQVVSRGSKGTFLEALYLPSGRSVLRRETLYR